MSKAILLTGFNNWGKSTQIFKLFGKKKFYKGGKYPIKGLKNQSVLFTVQPQSNDDLGSENFVRATAERINHAPAEVHDLFCAFCPTREIHNNSLDILNEKPFCDFDEIHLLLLKYKWDFHAELRIAEIQTYLSLNPKNNTFIIDADKSETSDKNRLLARNTQIVDHLNGLYK